MNQQAFYKNQELIASLALVMVENPRANLQELAQAVGISKATLYRFCRTRIELETRLIAHSMQAVSIAIENAGLTKVEPGNALKQLTENLLINKEVVTFLAHHCQSNNLNEGNWTKVLDTFFLHGQQLGVFRIDIPAVALTELWISILIGAIDAERRGTIARVGLDNLINTLFLYGAKTKK